MRLIILLGIFLFLSVFLFSQNISQFLLGGSEKDYGRSLFQLPNGSYLTTIERPGIQFGDRDIIIASIDQDGEIIWSKVYGTNDRDCIRNFVTDDSGNMIFISWTWTGQDDWNIFKIDQLGNLMNYVTIGEGGDDELHYIEPTASGQYILCGNTSSYHVSSMKDLYFASMNSDLSFNWFKTLGTTRKEYSRMVRYCSDTTLIATASRCNSDNSSSDLCLVKMTIEGEIIWAFDYDGGQEDLCWGVIEIPGGGFITSGSSNSNGAGGYDIHVARFNKHGEPVWSKLFGGPEDDKGYELVQSNNNYFICGTSRSFHEDNADLILLEINDQGDLENSFLYGGSGEDNGTTLSKANNGNLLLAGVSSSFGLEDYAALFIVTDENGSSCCSRIPETITETELPLVKTPVVFTEGSDFSYKTIDFTADDLDLDIRHICLDNLKILGPDSVCPFEEHVQFTISPSIDIEIEWIIPDDWVLTSNQNDTAIILNVSDSSGFIYIVNSFCDNEIFDSLYVTIFNTVQPDIGNDTTICDNESFLLEAGTGYTSYLWQDSTSLPFYEVTGSGTYWVTVSDEHGCYTADTITIAQYPSPVIDLGSDTAVCSNELILLNAGFGFESYLWQNGSENQFLYADQTGSYWVIVTDENSCSGYDTINLQFIRPDPCIGSDTSICPGDSATFTAVCGFAGYTWQNGSELLSYTTTESGIVWCEVTDSMGCVGRDSVFVDIVFPPSVSLENDTVLCEGDSIQLNVSPGDSALSFKWMNGSTDSVLNVYEEGLYWVSVSNICGSDADSIFVSVHQLPFVNLGNDTLINVNSSIELNAGKEYDGYLWSDGSEWQTITVTEAGSYWVNVFDGICYNTDTINIEPIACDLFIPNVFTPNGDGPNDYFFTETSQDITAIELRVFNRWGEIVWESTTMNDKWDGNRNGSRMAEGTYFWVLSYSCKGSPQSINRRGTVTLLR